MVLKGITEPKLRSQLGNASPSSCMQHAIISFRHPTRGIYYTPYSLFLGVK